MKPENTPQLQSKDLGGITVACLLIMVAIIALWDTTRMSDADSYIFPRAIALAMTLFSLVFIALQLFRSRITEEARFEIGREKGRDKEDGSVLRRTGLVVAMLLAALVMPWLGFVLAGLMVFAAIMFLSMYDHWTFKRFFFFTLTGLLIVIGFYFLFAKLLLVPLPLGSAFS